MPKAKRKSWKYIMSLAEKSEFRNDPVVVESANRAVETLKKYGFPKEILERQSRRIK